MISDDDKYIDICQDIEIGLKNAYESNASLTDDRCAYALDRAKIAVKQRFGFAIKESCNVAPDLQVILDSCVEVAVAHVNKPNGPDLREFLALIEKVRRSVRRHSQDGNRAYYNFVRQFLQ